MYFIYAYQNNINGKIYIGQTNNLYQRDKAHICNQHNTYIDNAIQKYGRYNFEYWTISICDTVEQANQEEIYWIAEMRSQLGIKNLYNLSDGGEASFRGRKHTLENRRKMSERHMGSNNPFYGKGKKGFTNGGSFRKGNPGHKGCVGKSWKLVDGKRVWFDKNDISPLQE